MYHVNIDYVPLSKSKGKDRLIHYFHLYCTLLLHLLNMNDKFALLNRYSIHCLSKI